jgi:hypothetical protein
MYARVTLLELDPVRLAVDDAVEMFERELVPQLRAQDGYQGAYVLTTPEGKALLMTLWGTEEEADAAASTGFYAEQLGRYMALFKAPPGRERYRVAFADASALAPD